MNINLQEREIQIQRLHQNIKTYRPSPNGIKIMKKAKEQLQQSIQYKQKFRNSIPNQKYIFPRMISKTKQSTSFNQSTNEDLQIINLYENCTSITATMQRYNSSQQNQENSINIKQRLKLKVKVTSNKTEVRRFKTQMNFKPMHNQLTHVFAGKTLLNDKTRLTNKNQRLLDEPKAYELSINQEGIALRVPFHCSNVSQLKKALKSTEKTISKSPVLKKVEIDKNVMKKNIQNAASLKSLKRVFNKNEGKMNIKSVLNETVRLKEKEKQQIRQNCQKKSLKENCYLFSLNLDKQKQNVKKNNNSSTHKNVHTKNL